MTPVLPLHAAATCGAQISVEDLRLAFDGFTRATASFSATYAALQTRLRDLDVQLAATNEELERNLAEKEKITNCLEAVMSALPVGVIVVDVDGRVVTVNSAVRRMLDLPEEPTIGRRLDEVLSGIRGARTIIRSLNGDFSRGQTVEISIASSTGAERLLEVVLLTATAERQKDFGGVLVFHDVTELKRLEQRSARASRLAAMGEMAMNVAHEIRNPLGSIELFASALARDLEDRPHQKQLAQFISNGVRSIESIVENVLQFNRPRTLSRELIAISAIINEALQYARHLFEQRQIEVVWRPVAQAFQPARNRPENAFGNGDFNGQAGKPAPLDAEIDADTQLLKQVFLNLALNAGQAMEHGGRLEIAIEVTAATVIIEMADNGSGIPPELLPKIFDPFITTKPKGTGLGLTIVHNIITAHGGTIEISNRPAGGACVAIELPRATYTAEGGCATEETVGVDAELEFAQEA